MNRHTTTDLDREEMTEMKLMLRLLQGAPDGELSDAVRVRLPQSTLRQLKQLEQAAHDRGLRQVTTSSILRASVDSFLAGVRETAPDILHEHDEVPQQH